MQLPVLPTTNTTDRLQRLLPQLFEVDERVGDAYLRLQVTPDIGMVLPLDCVEETQLLSPQAITPMPNMPQHIFGLMRMRGQVLWLSSLAHLLGLTTAIETTYRYETIVIRYNAATNSSGEGEVTSFLGLVVNQIRGSLRLTADDISPISANVPPHLIPFISGQINQDNETLLVINPDTLARTNDHAFSTLTS
jgi:twitching motility protein PilI